MATRPAGYFARRSIGTKLPLAVSALILLVGVALSTAAYLALRRAALERAEARLTSLTSQFRQTFGTSIEQAKARARTTAGKPALSAYLRDPRGPLRAAAIQAMEYEGPLPEQSLLTELRDPTGHLVLAAMKGGTPVTVIVPPLGESDSADFSRVFPSLASGDSAAMGRLFAQGDSLLYPVVARVPGQPGGYLVNWRVVGTAPQAREQVSRLLGSGAAFYFGNSDGSQWSDLGHPASAPPVELERLRGTLRFDRPGPAGEVLASASAIPGAPWSFTIEFPLTAIYAPVRGFLRTLVVIAGLCVTAGFLIAWLLSRRITEPLRRLTDAADAIAAGDVARRVQIPRADELGRLGESFDAMARQIADSRQRLEETVASRTSELHDTLHQLQETQEALVRREKLALLGQLASGVGHELRNPLGVMTNAVYYLESILPEAPDEVQEYLGILRRQIRLSAKIVNDLLDLSRTTPAHRQAVTLRSIADEQLERLALNGCRVEMDVPDTLPLVQADPVHAGQVVHNLLLNAVQAMGEGGGILRLSARSDPAGFVHLEVADTGPGIAPENLGKIFEPLFTTKARGIGLGLAVSRSLAQANGGDVRVARTSGQGAAFILTLPLAADPG